MSDADRTAVADRLAQHYADGRLDPVEFDGRLERTLAAKTVADLDGLFEGLPGGVPGWPSQQRPPIAAERLPARSGLLGRAPGAPVRRGRGRSPRLVFLVVVALITAAVVHALVQAAPLWPLLVLLAVFVWLRRHRHRRL